MSETQDHPSRAPWRVALIMNAGDVGKTLLTCIPIVLMAWYVSAGVTMHSCTPGFGRLRPIPDGYQSIGTFQAARTHDFPALHDEPAPAPVAGSGHLTAITDSTLYGVSEAERPDPAPDVRSLRIKRVFGPSITAHLETPLDPELHEHLLSLHKGAIVTIAGIGHGEDEHTVYIYPVHQVDGIEP